MLSNVFIKFIYSITQPCITRRERVTTTYHKVLSNKSLFLKRKKTFPEKTSEKSVTSTNPHEEITYISYKLPKIVVYIIKIPWSTTLLN